MAKNFMATPGPVRDVRLRQRKSSMAQYAKWILVSRDIQSSLGGLASWHHTLNGAGFYLPHNRQFLPGSRLNMNVQADVPTDRSASLRTERWSAPEGADSGRQRQMGASAGMTRNRRRQLSWNYAENGRTMPTSQATALTGADIGRDH